MPRPQTCERCRHPFQPPPDFPFEKLCDTCAEERLWAVLCEPGHERDRSAVEEELSRCTLL